MNMDGQILTPTGLNTSIGTWPKTPTGMTTISQMTTPTGPKLNGDSQNVTPGRRLVQSPSFVTINPNDDETERARVRAARAEQRRRSFGGLLQPVGTGQACVAPKEDCNILSQDSLSALLQNCLKLSNANKINQGNTWDLELIDHLSDLVKNDIDVDEQTNFQLASCTLETGVKIYSYRVDSVHSEAYKLLGGLGRSANEQTTTESAIEDGSERGPNQQQGSKEAAKKGAPTLLASNEAINLKKIDVAFNVDPLFHQTSALFDDGGAQGLLLHNLSVYSGCEVVFDSFEVPELKMKAQAALVKEGSDIVDLSIMNEYINMADTLERMMDVLGQAPEMTPTLKEIIKLFDDPRRAEFEAEGAQVGPSCQTPDSLSPSRSWSGNADFDGAQYDDPGEIFNEDGGFDNVDNGSFNGGASQDSRTWSDTNGEQEDIDGGDGSGEVFMSQGPLEWLAMSTGIPAKSNAWAGPDHWKYSRPKEDLVSDPADGEGKEKTQRKRKEPFSIDYDNPQEVDQSAFNPPKNPRSLLLPQSINPQSTLLLPEDYHFEAASLAKFTLRPSVWVFRRRSKRFEQGTRAENFQDISNEAVWGGDDQLGEWEDEGGHSDVEDPMGVDLVPEPRKVQKIAITYDKHAKQVDVRLLKGVLWEEVQHGPSQNVQEQNPSEKEKGLSFQEILQNFPEDCPAAAPEDISVHLCFICLLHLANEHCLRIDGCSTMDDLRIFFANDDSEVLSDTSSS